MRAFTWSMDSIQLLNDDAPRTVKRQKTTIRTVRIDDNVKV